MGDSRVRSKKSTHTLVYGAWTNEMISMISYFDGVPVDELWNMTSEFRRIH